jgi:hypothetical protein
LVYTPHPAELAQAKGTPRARKLKRLCEELLVSNVTLNRLSIRPHKKQAREDV